MTSTKKNHHGLRLKPVGSAKTVVLGVNKCKGGGGTTGRTKKNEGEKKLVYRDRNGMEVKLGEKKREESPKNQRLTKVGVEEGKDAGRQA